MDNKQKIGSMINNQNCSRTRIDKTTLLTTNLFPIYERCIVLPLTWFHLNKAARK